jgi:DHA1 family tetracycline resistance protein-like MFS transporter
MTQLFSAFTGSSNPYYFPGAPMVMGGVLTLLSLLLAMRALTGFGGVKSED